ncbi:hypothetical protein GCM10027321_23000 [Massilia terrae]|uniref:Lipoprotein n=1 Tax=Massilia terrae TaxID=1811224 RepID=A0ABT2CXC1_9BURK|nr:hypothetical protein [Massilia terrae]MCS0658607.1 hypothetical protein [Massilia terrae]
MTRQTLAALLCAVALTACTSATVRKAEAEYQQSRVAYGAVVAVKPADIAGQCASMPHPSFAPVCNSPANYDQARVAVLNSTRMVSGWVFVPKDWKVRYGAIVKLDPYGTVVATELAAAQQRRGCEWKGYELDKVTGKDRLSIAEGVATGLLILPSLAVTLDDSFHEGGVECDGWSFRKLLHYS